MRRLPCRWRYPWSIGRLDLGPDEPSPISARRSAPPNAALDALRKALQSLDSGRIVGLAEDELDAQCLQCQAETNRPIAPKPAKQLGRVSIGQAGSRIDRVARKPELVDPLAQQLEQAGVVASNGELAHRSSRSLPNSGI